MKDGRKFGYFDTKYMTVLRIEQILHNFEDQKFVNFFNLEQVDFRVTLVIYFNIHVHNVLHNSHMYTTHPPTWNLKICALESTDSYVRWTLRSRFL